MFNSNSLIDYKIYSSLAKLRVCESQYAFSKLMGRSPSYFSCLQSQKMALSVLSLLKLKHAVLSVANAESHPRKQTLLRDLCGILDAEVSRRSSGQTALQ
jgi:hypothetical protein